jgi:coenzyme F420 hydrogenase subunit beta
MEHLHGLDELNRTVIGKGLCAACGACVAGCPYITGFRGKTVVLDRCTVATGRCFQYCPMTTFDPEAVSMSVFGLPASGEALGHYEQALASRATDSSIAALGQGGGTVTTLMLTALDKGIIDAAVLAGAPAGEEFPRGIVASSAAEIAACAGSRYVGSHSLAALRQALDQGYERIGVIALPCQVRSLRKMALYDLKNENLKERIALVVGLFCNWAFSSREFNSFLSGRFDVKTIKKFHIPPPPAGVIEVQAAGDVLSIPLDEVRPLIQEACRICPDMTSEFADVSVGMYEGRPGWNTLLVRTHRGRSLVEKAVAEARIELDEFPASNLDHLGAASLQKRQRASSV